MRFQSLNDNLAVGIAGAISNRPALVSFQARPRHMLWLASFATYLRLNTLALPQCDTSRDAILVLGQNRRLPQYLLSDGVLRQSHQWAIMVVSEVLPRVRHIAADLAENLPMIERDLAAAGGDGQQTYARLTVVLNHCLTALTELNIWGPDNRLPSSEIWNAAGHWLARGWLQNQAHDKPRGYAGDHQMLTRIYENWCCDDPLGRLFDRYFQAQAAPQAVRNRMRMMTGWICETLGAKRPAKIAVVGSAFGLEIRDALTSVTAEARPSLTAVLLDLDPAALEFARNELQPLLPPEQLVLQPTNLFRLPDRASLATKLAASNLILCPGLFDYLDDAAAVQLIRCLFHQLSPGGRLVIFQFAPHNPTRAYMEWFANWYLTYRDQDAFQRLVEFAELQSAAIEFAAEPLGIDLYAKISRNE
jgi:extracellular factor (EF) 3-hydroxypalmitic acid methyl ester biosynthesis protein